MGRDPLNEEEEQNLYKFCSNDAIWKNDELGLECTIIYSIKLHRISVSKKDKNGNVLRIGTNRVFSGDGIHRNNPDSVDVPDEGPIPPGRYYVIKRQSGGTMGEFYDIIYNIWNDNDRRKWLAFIAIDDKIDDSTTVKGVVRSNFRMHSGEHSMGCITFMDKTVFENVRNFILDTDAKTVKNANGEEYIYYGILEVKEE